MLGQNGDYIEVQGDDNSEFVSMTVAMIKPFDSLVIKYYYH